MLNENDIVIDSETSEVSVVTFVPDGPQQIPVGLFSISADHPVRRALEVGQKVLDRIPEESEIGYIYPANDINKPGLGMVIVELRPKPEPRPITGPAYLRLMRLYHALGHPSGADEIDVFDSIQWWRKMALAGQRLAKTADNMPLCVGDYAWAGSIQVRVVSIDENNVAVVDFDGSRSCRAVRSLHWYPKAAKENLNG